MLAKIAGLLLVLFTGEALSLASAQERVLAQGPVRVKIEDDKPVFVEGYGPIDPQRRVEYLEQQRQVLRLPPMQPTPIVSGPMGLRVTVEGKVLHCDTIHSIFKVDQKIQTMPGQLGFLLGQPGAGNLNQPGLLVMQMVTENLKLPRKLSGKERDGYMTVGKLGGLRITQTVEVVATRAEPGKQRRRDAVVVRYAIENKDSIPHQLALRCLMDVFIVDNDGALFAAPTQPGKILDGVELKDRMMPDYLQLLQKADLQKPNFFVAHLTCNLGKSVEGPQRVVLTSIRACIGNNLWETPVMRANGDSALVLYWDSREIKPGGKRELAYALGQCLALPLEDEGNVKLDLVGSFGPNKLFTIDALVTDTYPGQSLTLELPDGLERLEGKETQPVSAGDADGNGLVRWKARVLRPGKFTLRVHSTTGVTQTKIITVTRGPW